MTGACWSTAICTESERHALGLATDGEWLLTCRLSDGHLGEHATDASVHPRRDRRTWLIWNNRAIHRLLDREPCPMNNRAGSPCLLFATHGGMHYYGAPVQSGHSPVPSGSIDSPDVRMPGARVEAARNGVESSAATLKVAVAGLRTFDSGPLDVAAERPADGNPRPRHIGDTGPRPVGEAIAAPSGSDAEADDEVAAALVELATAIGRLAEAVRRRAE